MLAQVLEPAAQRVVLVRERRLALDPLAVDRQPDGEPELVAGGDGFEGVLRLFAEDDDPRAPIAAELDGAAAPGQPPGCSHRRLLHEDHRLAATRRHCAAERGQDPSRELRPRSAAQSLRVAANLTIETPR